MVARTHHLDVLHKFADLEGDGNHEVVWQTIQCSAKKKWSATKQKKQIVNSKSAYPHRVDVLEAIKECQGDRPACGSCLATRLNDLPKITLSETCQNQIENTKNGTVARAHHLDVIEGDGAA